jgi:isopenicillin-N N-acyltransferase-like protein
LTGDSAALGRRHGELFGPAIREITEERMRLCRDRFWAGDTDGGVDLGALAAACWDAQRSYDDLTTEELEALAVAAGVPAPHLLIANGFTDFVDAVRGARQPDNDPGQCTAALVAAGNATDGRAHLAQTWDMHTTATPHIRLLTLHATDQPRVTVFTLCGGIGMIGMNEHGLAVGINNLVTTDGRPGVLWTTAVRRLLRERTADDALAVLEATPLAGAHHYLLLDAEGAGYSVEATPTLCRHSRLTTKLLHTNHCVLPEAAAIEAEKAPVAYENTRQRLETASAWVEAHPDKLNRTGLRELLSLPGSICHGPFEGYDIETGGAVVMTPRDRSVDAVWARPTPDRFRSFSPAAPAQPA